MCKTAILALSPPLKTDAVFSTPIEMPTAIADPSGKVLKMPAGMLIDESTNAGNTFFVIGKVGFKGIPATISLRDGPHAVGVSPIDLLHVEVIAGGGDVESPAMVGLPGPTGP